MEMVTERNGLLVFPRGEDHSAHPAVRKLNGFSLGDVRFPHGFFLVEEDGAYILPASAEDRIQRLQKAFPELTADALGQLCRHHHPGCAGECEPPDECTPVSDPGDQWYGCVCLPGGG